jgi:hypothetical protein
LAVLCATLGASLAGAGAQESDDPSDPAAAETSTAGTPGDDDATGSAQRAQDDLLAVSAVSPWVAPDGEFVVRFAPTTQVPAGAELTYTIHQALAPSSSSTLRSQVESVLEGSPPGRILQRPRSRLLADYGDPSAGSALTIPIRSESGDAERTLLPNAGIHPVELVLTDPSGPELWRQVVFLNRLPDAAAADEDPPVAVTLLVPIETPPTLDPTGVPSFDIEQRASLDAASTLLGQLPDAPLTLGVGPNTLDGLARTAERWSDRLIAAVRDAVDPSGSSNAKLLSLPYVHVDTGGLVAAGADGEVERQRLLGAQVNTEIVASPGRNDTWALDDTLTPAALPVLASLGVTSVVLPVTSVELGGAVSAERAMTGPLRVDGGEGLRAIVYDIGLSQRLANTAVEPSVRAHEVVSLLMANWFTTQRSDDGVAASVIVVPPTVEPAVLEALVPSLDGSGPLLADTSAAIVPEGGDGTRVELVGTDPPDERGVVADAEETRRQIAAYQSMVGAANPSVSLWERLNAETLAADLGVSERNALRDSVRGQIAGEIARIEPPRDRRVVLTSRETTIPLRIRNDLPYEVQLLLYARSPRLDIEGGDTRRIVLAPGENRIDLPVSVQAPGESLLRIELSTPDEGIPIAAIDLPVRSTAISGVGAALSVVSIVFLLLWWVHTHRRKRREAARGNGTHPATAAPTPETHPPPLDVDSTTTATRTDSVTEGG